MTGDDEPDDDSSPGIGTSSIKRIRKLAWIAEADAEKVAERLDRLAGDRELASDLERAGYTGGQASGSGVAVGGPSVAVRR